MKKIICLAVILSMLLFSLCSCKTRYIPVWGEDLLGDYFVMLKLPTKNAGGETTLEFWIGEKVEESDFDGHTKVYNGYLGKGYDDSVTLGITSTDYYVHYEVTNYPKVDSETKGILSIEITDPKVMVYGLTTESSLDDFAEVFEALGAKVNKYDSGVNAKIGDVWFQLSKPKRSGIAKIRINTDQTGIVYVD